MKACTTQGKTEGGNEDLGLYRRELLAVRNEEGGGSVVMSSQSLDHPITVLLQQPDRALPDLEIGHSED